MYFQAKGVHDHPPPDVYRRTSTSTVVQPVSIYLFINLFETYAEQQQHENSSHCISALSQKAPTLASCSFDKHGPIMIIFGQQHQHTFKNDTHI